jgi:hypothetical protein
LKAHDLGNLSDASVKQYATTIRNVQAKCKQPQVYYYRARQLDGYKFIESHFTNGAATQQKELAPFRKGTNRARNTAKQKPYGLRVSFVHVMTKFGTQRSHGEITKTKAKSAGFILYKY